MQSSSTIARLSIVSPTCLCWKSWKISILTAPSWNGLLIILLDALKMWWSMANLLGLPLSSLEYHKVLLILGPLLFLIYINDLSEINLCQGAKITLYADDVLLHRTISSPEDFVTLQEDINKVGNWSSTNFLTLNRAKCNFMTISRRRAVSTPPTSLLLDGHPLDKVETFKYLGVLLSHDLSWGEHVQSTCAKAKNILGLLYRQFYTR